jgi:ABC-type nitrate/sulfonate/bicarbonate transport system substrate-binding protein
VATSAELDPGHPEKVLMVRREFAGKHANEHVALVAALLEACQFCATPENHERITATLSRPEFVGLHTRGAGADNIRNLNANPTAGIDPHELIDVIPLCQ